MKTNMTKIIKSLNLKGSVSIRLNGRTARIDQEAGNIELSGDNHLLAECVRLLKKEKKESLNKVNTANYIRTNLKNAGLYVRTNKKGSK